MPKLLSKYLIISKKKSKMNYITGTLNKNISQPLLFTIIKYKLSIVKELEIVNCISTIIFFGYCLTICIIILRKTDFCFYFSKTFLKQYLLFSQVIKTIL